MKQINRIFTQSISVMLVVVLIGTNCIFATDNSDSRMIEGITVENHISERQPNRQEILLYSQYILNLDAISRETSVSDVVSTILSYCTQTGTSITIENGEHPITCSNYSANGLYTIIPMCTSDACINSIETLNSNVYIRYTSSDNKNVVLAYNDSGIMNYVVYNGNTDTAFINDGAECTITEGFREGITITMSDELIGRIYSLYENGNLDEIRNISGIRVIEAEDGISIEPEIDGSSLGLINTVAEGVNRSDPTRTYGNGVDYLNLYDNDGITSYYP